MLLLLGKTLSRGCLSAADLLCVGFFVRIVLLPQFSKGRLLPRNAGYGLLQARIRPPPARCNGGLGRVAFTRGRNALLLVDAHCVKERHDTSLIPGCELSKVDDLALQILHVSSEMYREVHVAGHLPFFSLSPSSPGRTPNLELLRARRVALLCCGFQRRDFGVEAFIIRFERDVPGLCFLQLTLQVPLLLLCCTQGSQRSCFLGRQTRDRIVFLFRTWAHTHTHTQKIYFKKAACSHLHSIGIPQRARRKTASSWWWECTSLICRVSDSMSLFWS